MSGWTKLFAAIVTSSVWVEDHATVRVWVAMLATADADGIVEGSVPGFANLARVTIPEMETALTRLSSPDPHSRTPDHEGRRIEAVEGGWRVLNYLAYRERAQAKEGSRAPYFRAYRARRAQQEAQRPAVARNTEAEARGKRRDTEAERTAAAATLAAISTTSNDHGHDCTDGGPVDRIVARWAQLYGTDPSTATKAARQAIARTLEQLSEDLILDGLAGGAAHPEDRHAKGGRLVVDLPNLLRFADRLERWAIEHRNAEADAAALAARSPSGLAELAQEGLALRCEAQRAAPEPAALAALPNYEQRRANLRAGVDIVREAVGE